MARYEMKDGKRVLVNRTQPAGQTPPKPESKPETPKKQETE